MSGYDFHQNTDASAELNDHSNNRIAAGFDSSGGWYSTAGSLVTIVATGALTRAAHGGRINLLGEVGGNALVTLTLPAAIGSGVILRFIVSVVNTSNYVLKVADATDTIDGQITTASTGDTPDLAQPWVTAAASDTITLNGTTSGGVAIGDEFTLTDIALNQWAVKGVTTSSGTQITPFSATVA